VWKPLQLFTCAASGSPVRSLLRLLSAVPERARPFLARSLAKLARRCYQETMKRILLSLLVLSGIFLALFATRAGSASDPLVEVTRKIAAEISENGKAYADLRELT